VTTHGSFAEIIIASSAKGLDKSFHYAIGSEFLGKIMPGHRVLVPFGKTRKVEGYVISLTDSISFDASKVKQISDKLEDFPIFSKTMLELARWMSERYAAPLASCLKTIMPAGISMKNDYVVQFSDVDFKNDGVIRGKQGQVLKYIKEHGTVSQRELHENFGNTVQTAVKALEDRELIQLRHIYEAPDYTMRIITAFINDDLPNFEELSAGVFEKGGKQAVVLEMLMDVKSSPMSDIQLRLNISPSPIKSLEQKGLLRLEKVEIRREVMQPVLSHHSDELILTDEQKAAIYKLSAAVENGSKLPILIHGVTASGKTEIYMQIIQKVLDKNKQAIMLVPEISLTPQAVASFAERFGAKVTVTHSRLSLGERYDQWKRAKDGQVQVIIGPRSAIFTPFANLGIIIIDEEHENTYKSETSPKYSTIDVAQKLSELCGCIVVLGSATPALQSYYRAKSGEFELITLKNRINNRFADIEIADMRAELAGGNKTMFSVKLHHGIAQNLASKQQIILFLNRRGHSTFVSCRSCGHVLGCPNCNVNYTYHIFNHKLMCHYCSAAAKMPNNCPACGSIYIKHFGVGTQKIEEYLNQEFPNARVLRMDLDTTGRKNSHSRIIQSFADGQADILVGTQMIAKGLNFPGVSLVGIVAADMALNNGDYRSAETAYQLITQVSGRAGRGDSLGRVIIQTYNPEHYSIKYAREGNYEAFYEHEIQIRKQMDYPPFSYIYMVVFAGQNEKIVIQMMHKLAQMMHFINKKKLCEILGPAPAVIPKIRMNYRWKLLVKCSDREILKKFVLYCLNKLEKNEDVGSINISLTPDPVFIV